MPSLQDLEQRYLAPLASAPVHRGDTLTEPLVDGLPYLSRVYAAIDATTAGDTVLHSSLLLEPEVDLRGRPPSDPGHRSVAQLLADKAAAGVDVRVLMAYGVFSGSAPFFARFTPFRANALAAHALRTTVPSGGGPPPLADRVLLDWTGGLIGSNHQKFTVVHSAGRLDAFLAGIDFAANRLDQKPHDQQVLDGRRWGWHDAGVHLRGSGARDVWATFALRWREVSSLPRRVYWVPPFTVRPVNPPTPVPDPGAAPGVPAENATHQSVQVLRSFGRWKIDSILTWERRPWAELPAGGVQEVHATLSKAIAAAQRYVYVEDQYLSEMLGGDSHYELFGHLRDAAARGVRVILVGSGTRDPADVSLTPINQTLNADVQKKIVNPLTPAQRRNVVLYRVEQLTVHSKLILIDDQFASIGSANLFSRSMSGTDHELTAALVADDAFVQDLRASVWAEHLRVDPTPPGVVAALADVDTALGIWRAEWLPPNTLAGTWRTNGLPAGFAPAERVLTLVGPA